MSDLDKILINTLSSVQKDLEDCLEYVKNIDWPEYEEIRQDYEDSIAELKEIRKQVKCLDDLAEMNEEEIGFIFELIENYEADFVISPSGSENFEQDMNCYDNIEQLLGLFFDDEEDYEE